MNRPSSSPEALLAAARHLLETEDAKTVGVWARAVAYLSRQALEAYLDELWLEKAPGTERTSTRAQLICLPCFLRSEVLARKITYTWNALSHACHHHSYELAPHTERAHRVARGLGRASGNGLHKIGTVPIFLF